MLLENDKILIQELTESFRRQLECYKELKKIVRQLLSRLVLSRGDLSQLAGGLKEKQELLGTITGERTRIAGMIEQWQLRKSEVGQCEPVDTFQAVLQQVTDAIHDFLNDETQLQKYLEGVVTRNSAPSPLS